MIASQLVKPQNSKRTMMMTFLKDKLLRELMKFLKVFIQV